MEIRTGVPSVMSVPARDETYGGYTYMAIGKSEEFDFHVWDIDAESQLGVQRDLKYVSGNVYECKEQVNVTKLFTPVDLETDRNKDQIIEMLVKYKMGLI